MFVTFLPLIYRMTWISHKALTFSFIFALTNNLPFAIVCMIGAVLPDLLEGKGYMSQKYSVQKRWEKFHRTYTHWFVPYLIIFFIIWANFAGNPFKFNPLIQINSYISQIILWVLFSLSVGAIFHIIQDAISGKVPLFSPTKKNFGLYLLPTRSFKEYLFTASTVIIIFLLR